MMQPQSIVAEQTSRSRFLLQGPFPARELDLIVRLEAPADEGADVSIVPGFASSWPWRQEDALTQRLYQGVHGGIAAVGEPLPGSGIAVDITQLSATPPIDDGADIDAVRLLGDVLEELVEAAVTALWTGVIRLGAKPPS